jgi:DNA repair protein RecO (recombination protein O)
VFARFTLFENRDSYTLAGAEAADYFTELTKRLPGSLYGFYFLELASYYGREGLEAEGMVNLVYAALRALLREQMEPEQPLSSPAHRWLAVRTAGSERHGRKIPCRIQGI